MYRFFGILPFALFVCVPFSHVSAKIDERWVTNFQGDKIFQLRFFNKPTDGSFRPSGTGSQISSTIFTEYQKDAIADAFTYWTHVIKRPNFGFFDSPTYTVINFGRLSSQNSNDIDTNNAIAMGTANLLTPVKPLGDYGAHAYIAFGDILRPQGKHSFVPLVPSAEGADLFSVAIHEFTHTLFFSSAPLNKKFPSSLNLFEKGLRDKSWKPARPDMEICETAEECRNRYNAFDQRYAKFQGTNVTKVLNGLFPEEVVNTKRDDITASLELSLPLLGVPLYKDFAHTKLVNSLIGIDRFRNYSSLMEAELAMLQDLGYVIDRRNFFGYSVYGNYRLIANASPFFDRTSDGTAYKKDTYNTSPLGVGLHIYGSYNYVVQSASLLTNGPGAVGIRIDGRSNLVMVPEDVKVHSNGPYGRGLLVAYGKDHILYNRGEIKATGEKGIGASFNFGGTILGTRLANITKKPENASSQHTGGMTEEEPYSEPVSYSSELNGPLVEKFDITGTLEGSYAAIFIGKNAHVSKINIMGKAHISGDIISNTEILDAQKKLRPTFLTFGYQASNNGAFTPTLDSNFDFTYESSIFGFWSIVPVFSGGNTKLISKKAHKVLSLSIEPNGTLQANGSITLANKDFINKGTLIPTNPPDQGFGRLIVQGNYTQTETGRLKIAFDSKTTASLSVNGTANLKGTLDLEAKPDFYPEEWISPEPFFEAIRIVGDFSSTTTNSPTLEFTTLRSSREGYQTYHAQKKGQRGPDTQIESTPAQGQNPPVNVVIHNNETNTVQAEDPPILTLDSETNKQASLNTQGSRLTLLSQVPPLKWKDHGQEGWISEAVETKDTLQGTRFGFSRPRDAYSRYGADENSRSVGRMLRSLVGLASGDVALQDVYKALDFSAIDGSQIRVALSQMSPRSYSAVFASDVGREQQISDIMSTLPSWGQNSPFAWNVFAIPFGGRLHQNSSQDLRVPYSSTEQGLVFGAERRFSAQSKWVFGLHGSVSQGDLTVRTEDSGQIKAKGGDVGLHVRYEENPKAGVFFSAQARVGFQNNEMRRQLSIGSYGGPLNAHWTTWGATAAARGGYLFKLGDFLAVGPVVSLDYTSLSSPAFTERSSLPTALTFEDNSFYSTRGQLGLKGKLAVNEKFALEAQATWGQELLDNVLVQQAHFAAYSQASFLIENGVLPGRTLNLEAQVSYDVTPQITLAARGTKTLRSGINATLGQLTGVWRF